jgi:uncharacterized protein (TIGR02996 family)
VPKEAPVTDRAALFAAILANPDEDTPRLALADWLDEHEDAQYAGFIRTQIELAKRPEWDALWVRSWFRNRNVITGREFDLFEPDLAAGLAWPSLSHDAFRRGFPWHVESTGPEPFLREAANLFAAMPLQALTVHALAQWRTPVDLLGLFGSSHLERLRYFGITLARLGADTVQEMTECPHLRNVTEFVTHFAGFLPGAIERLFRPPLIERLESIRLADSSVGMSDLADAIASAGGPHRLRRFVFKQNNLGGYRASDVFAAPLLQGLKEFEISGYDLGEVNLGALCKSPVVRGLESLALHGTKPGVPGARVIAECAALSSLKRLRFGGNHLGVVAMKALAASPYLTGLRVLNLSNNPLGDKGAIALAKAPCMANLIELDLMHCDVGNAGAEALIDALSADHLISLELYSSGVKLSARVQKKIAAKLRASR